MMQTCVSNNKKKKSNYLIVILKNNFHTSLYISLCFILSNEVMNLSCKNQICLTFKIVKKIVVTKWLTLVNFYKYFNIFLI